MTICSRLTLDYYLYFAFIGLSTRGNQAFLLELFIVRGRRHLWRRGQRETLKSHSILRMNPLFFSEEFFFLAAFLVR